MKKHVVSGVVALLVLLSGTAALGLDPKTPQTPVNPVPCPPVTGGVAGQVTVMPKPCPPTPKLPSKPPEVVDPKPGQLPKVSIPATPEQAVKVEQRRKPGDDIDDWVEEQVDRPISAMRGLYQTTMLTQPNVFSPSQGWVVTGWLTMLPLGIILCLLALSNHARHTFKGTDSLHGRNPLARFGVPGLCLVMILVTPVGWDVLQGTQEHIWDNVAPGFNRANADDVLGVVFPPAAVVDENGNVTHAPAGSIAPVRAKVGTIFSLGAGLAMIVMATLGFLAYLIGRLLVILCPLYLGITAFSHRLDPAVGWLDLLIRTNLLVSVFNGGWAVMRNLPTWMRWTLVDAVVFVVLVLPIMLGFIYLFWWQRATALFSDPLQLGGTAIIERLGHFAGRVGRTVSQAGESIGADRIITAGDRVAAWGERTVETGSRVAGEAARGNVGRALHNLVPLRLGGLTPRRLVKEEEGDESVCWQDGDQFVHYKHGIPVWSPAQPAGIRVAGIWKGESL